MSKENSTSMSLIQNAASGAIDAISGANIPEPIKKNFFKAAGQLCTAFFEIPTAYLEGVAAERRAETQARVRLIEKSSQEIADQMQFDPEYAKAAVKNFGQRVIREQVNLDQITQKAAEELTHSIPKGSDHHEDLHSQISSDWLNVFEKEASQKSSEEMQAAFAKVLAGEIASPNSYSIKSVKLLGSLDQPTAKLFQKFCSMCIVLRFDSRIVDARVPSLGGNASSNSLQKFGLGFGSLNLLQEHGLIIPEYNSWMDYAPCITDKETMRVLVPFEFGSNKWGLAKDESSQGNELKVTGVALSRSGQELMSAVAFEKEPNFYEDLVNWFKSQRLQLIRAHVAQP